jgi:hypothetical protein
MLERHQETFQAQSLDPTGLKTDKVVYLEGTLDKDHFGLSTDTFDEVSIGLFTQISEAHLVLDGSKRHPHCSRW